SIETRGLARVNYGNGLADGRPGLGESTQLEAGACQVGGVLAEAEAQEMLAASGAEEGRTGDGGDAGGLEQGTGLVAGGGSGDAGGVGEDVVGAGGDGGGKAGVGEGLAELVALGLIL